MRSGLWRALACVLLMVAPPTRAGKAERPYTVEDVLGLEGFGQVVVAPGGRWLVFERRTPLAKAFLFDQVAEDEVRNRLYRVDLLRPGPAEPLLPPTARAGDTLLGFSPSGTQAAVGRFDGRHWTLGIVRIADGAVRWLSVTPDFSPFRTTLGWVSEQRLLVIAQPRGRLPAWLGGKRREEAEFARAWQQRSAGGAAIVTEVGSGRFRDIGLRNDQVSLVTVDLATDREQILATGFFQNLTIAPDGRTAAIVSDEEAIRVTTPDPINQATEARRRRLRMLDLATGRSWFPCPACDLPYRMPVWSRSGRKLLFYSRTRDVGFEGGQVWEADSRTTKATQLDLHGLQPTVDRQRTVYDAVGLGWVGERPVLFARAPGGTAGRSDWYLLGKDVRSLTRSVDSPTGNLATMVDGTTVMLGTRAWMLSQAGARALSDPASAIEPVSSAASGVTPGSARRALLIQNASSATILPGSAGRIDVGSTGTRLLTASVEQRAVIGLLTDDHGAGTLLLNRAGRPPTALATINGFLHAVANPPPRQVSYRAAGTDTLTGWLYMPDNRSDRHKPPLIVLPYAGRIYPPDKAPSVGSPRQPDPTMNVSILRGRGYAVLLPSLPVPPARDHDPFDFATPILAAVDAVVAQGLVDPARLVLWGHSLGGYTAAMIVGETRRFNAAIASSGPYDFSGFVGSFGAGSQFDQSDQGTLQWAGYAETGPLHFRAMPWQNPQRYVANSPIYRAGRIETPLLILASDRDFVPLQQSQQLFSALNRQGKDAILLTYWGEEHGLTSPANIRDAYQRVFAWLDTHIGTP